MAFRDLIGLIFILIHLALVSQCTALVGSDLPGLKEGSFGNRTTSALRRSFNRATSAIEEESDVGMISEKLENLPPPNCRQLEKPPDKPPWEGCKQPHECTGIFSKELMSQALPNKIEWWDPGTYNFLYCPEDVTQKKPLIVRSKIPKFSKFKEYFHVDIAIGGKDGNVVKTALAFFCKKDFADKYGIDCSRIGLVGFSAGGIASQKAGQELGKANGVRAVVTLNGHCRAPVGKNLQVKERWLQDNFPKLDENAPSGGPGYLMFWGNRDQDFKARISELKEYFDKHNVEYVAVVMKGAGHGGPYPSEKIYQKSKEFLAQRLGGAAGGGGGGGATPTPTPVPAPPNPAPRPTPRPPVPIPRPTPRPPVPTPRPAPSPSGKCGKFCLRNNKPWSKKCKWKKCSGCPKCPQFGGEGGEGGGGASPTPVSRRRRRRRRRRGVSARRRRRQISVRTRLFSSLKAE